MILSRSETLCRLIKLRKTLHSKNNCSEIKKQLDQLLLDIIGVSQKNQHKISEIIHKAIENEIKAKTAVVAIHEIIIDNDDFKEKNGKKKKSNNNQLEELYQKGYR